MITSTIVKDIHVGRDLREKLITFPEIQEVDIIEQRDDVRIEAHHEGTKDKVFEIMEKFDNERRR